MIKKLVNLIQKKKKKKKKKPQSVKKKKKPRYKMQIFSYFTTMLLFKAAERR